MREREREKERERERERVIKPVDEEAMSNRYQRLTFERTQDKIMATFRVIIPNFSWLQLTILH